jgi:hypothetical protein
MVWRWNRVFYKLWHRLWGRKLPRVRDDRKWAIAYTSKIYSMRVVVLTCSTDWHWHLLGDHGLACGRHSDQPPHQNSLGLSFVLRRHYRKCWWRQLPAGFGWRCQLNAGCILTPEQHITRQPIIAIQLDLGQPTVSSLSRISRRLLSAYCVVLDCRWEVSTVRAREWWEHDKWILDPAGHEQYGPCGRSEESPSAT